jgi:hypothetical protein
MKIPSDWSNALGSTFRGKVLFQRHFHKPTGLEDGDCIRIRIGQVNALAEIFLNHEAIGSVSFERGSTAFEIEDQLEPRNLLEILVDLPLVDKESANLITLEGFSGGITGEVQIEIDSVESPS